MCGHFDTLTRLSQMMADSFGRSVPEPPVRDTIAPSLGAPIIIENPETRRIEVLEARFGLVPAWYRGSLKDWKATTFNARLDTVTEKRVFKGAWTYRHAIVPTEAFYEWSGPKSARNKWRVTRGDNQPLAFAGLWEEAYLAEGELWSFTILTREAGRDMAAIHPREPVVLTPDQWEAWLRRKPVDLTTPSPLRLHRETQAPPRLAETLDLF